MTASSSDQSPKLVTPARVRRSGDLFAPVLTLEQKLPEWKKGDL
jgi:hypothetical protein